jgi:molybdopterin-guanine dinucleotide biosynthesis protein A
MSFSAVLLCGGESQRMGRDKSLVEWNGTPLWQLQLEKLRALLPREIFLSARNDKPWRPRDVTLVLDAEPASCGPRGGIAAALRICQSDHLLVLAIDLPLIHVGYLKSMLQRIARGVGVVPVSDGRFEPVAAIYPRGVVDAFSRHAESLQTLLRELIDRGCMTAVGVQPRDRELFRNVNEPADLIAS